MASRIATKICKPVRKVASTHTYAEGRTQERWGACRWLGYIVTLVSGSTLIATFQVVERALNYYIYCTTVVRHTWMSLPSSFADMSNACMPCDISARQGRECLKVWSIKQPCGGMLGVLHTSANRRWRPLVNDKSTGSSKTQR